MSDEIQRMLGAHEAQISELKEWRTDFAARMDTRLSRMDGKLEDILTGVNSARGGWRMLAMLAAAASAIGAIVATVYHWLHG